MSHANISIFVSHVGCPQRCSFCDQNNITGTEKLPHKEDIDIAVKTAVSSKKYDANNTEIAFFGGSFTAINRRYMLELLESAGGYVKKGTVKGIRISTRPDFIDQEVLDILKNYGVTAIELGAQSMCDDVLQLNHRGHTAQDVRLASELIKQNGFSLGLQMMTGLFGSSQQKDIFTANEIIKLKPKTVRIYPTVTLKNTALEKYYNEGRYIPPTLEQTVSLCTELIEQFEKAGINVIRVGLHSIDEGRLVAGPWHPSLKELCDSKRYLDIILSKLNEPGKYTLYVSPGETSKAIGHKKNNILHLKQKGYICRVVEDEKVSPFCVLPERMNDSCI